MVSYSTDEEYQKVFLDFFKISEYDNDIVLSRVNKLYQEVKDIPEIREKMKIGASRINTDDLEMGLVMMFSYDYFGEFCKILENHKIKLS